MEHGPEQPSPTADRAPGTEATTHPHWHEYPIGRRGEAAHVVTGVLIAMVVGLALGGAVLFAVGLLNEQAQIGDAAALDLFGRAGMLVGCLVALVAALVYGLALGAEEGITGRAVRDAARAGADTKAVPTPEQVRSIIAPGCGFLFALLMWGLFLTVLLAIFPFYVLVEDGEVSLVSAAFIAPLALSVLLAWLIHKKVRPRRLAVRREIAAHWTSGHEGNVWGSVRKDTQLGEAVGRRYTDAGPRIQLGAGLTYAASVFAGLALIGILVALRIAYPSARHANQTISGIPELGERADLSPATEQFLDRWYIGILVLVVGGVALFVAGYLVEARARAVERAQIAEAVGDPDAPRPDNRILQRHSTRQPHRVAQVLAGLAGVGLMLGGTVLLLGTGGLAWFAEIYDGTEESFGGLVGPALVTIAISVLLLVVATLWSARANAVRGPLRRAVIARWPVRPDPKLDADSAEPHLWRRGPALSRNLPKEPASGSSASAPPASHDGEGPSAADHGSGVSGG